MTGQCRMIEDIFEKKYPDSGMKKGTVACCKEVDKANKRRSTPSTARNGPAMTDDRRDFMKSINRFGKKWMRVENILQGNRPSWPPFKVWNERAMMDGKGDFRKNIEKSTPSERNEWSNGIFLKSMEIMEQLWKITDNPLPQRGRHSKNIGQTDPSKYEMIEQSGMIQVRDDTRDFSKT